MASILVRVTQEKFAIDTRGGGSVKTEAEIRVMQPQAKKYLEPPETGRGKKQNVPWCLQGDYDPAEILTLDF